MDRADPSGLCPTSERGLYRDAFNAFLQDPALAAGSRQRRDFSGFVQGAPGGFLLSGYAAATGYDPLAGAGLSGGQRAFTLGLLGAGAALGGVAALADGAGGGGGGSSVTQQFIDDAIAKAEGLSLRPRIGQRDVDWNNVFDLTNLARQHGNWDFLRGNEKVILGNDGQWLTIDNGMHRILASLMSGVPLPDEMHIFGDWYSESRPW